MRFARTFSIVPRSLVTVLLPLVTAVGVAQTTDARPHRRLALGVETTIPIDLESDETHSTHDMVELRARGDLEWVPHFTSEGQTLLEKARQVRFDRPVWCLELTFKPLRMIHVDLPQPSGKMQRKLIWYLIYRVKNSGMRLIPPKDPARAGAGADQELAAVRTDEPVPFKPHFVLRSHGLDKEYLDRVIPVALAAIRQREDPSRPLLNSVEMAQHPIAVSTDRTDRSVWGVATWEDVDPRVDYFSVYVQGLTNAYRWVDPPDAYAAGDPPGRGRQFAYKTLQLNFWRPGDQYREHEEEIRYGVPEGKADLYGAGEGVDHAWVYR